MSTVIRTEISKRNPYYISKHRYLELKHFCLQYPEWQREYNRLIEMSNRGVSVIKLESVNGDRTADIGIRLAELSENLQLVRDTADLIDPCLGHYIFRAVTEERSYTWLRNVMNIPCSKGVYYGLYRKFWWLLSWRKNNGSYSRR